MSMTGPPQGPLSVVQVHVGARTHGAVSENSKKSPSTVHDARNDQECDCRNESRFSRKEHKPSAELPCLLVRRWLEHTGSAPSLPARRPHGNSRALAPSPAARRAVKQSLGLPRERFEISPARGLILHSACMRLLPARAPSSRRPLTPPGRSSCFTGSTTTRL